jgi:predicted dienelactone hydrolase
MKYKASLIAPGILLFFLFACNPVTRTSHDTTQEMPEITVTTVQDFGLPEESSQIPTTNDNVPVGESSFIFSEPGEYFPGNRVYTIVDENRNGREIELLIWYPAEEHTDADGKTIIRDASADLGGTPYPLILTGEDTGRYLFKSHLASHGFVLAIVRTLDSFADASFVVEGAQDFIFAIDQLASNPPPELAGVIDTDRVGVAGYTWDGGVSLAISGARVDPEFYLSQCEQPPPMILSFPTSWFEEICSLTENWDEFNLQIGNEITVSDDGLWQPITDDRILAVMPMAPDGVWLFGERGLDSVDRPTFIICATESPYLLESEYTFEHLGYSERFMVSFVGHSHGMVFTPEPAGKINHFVTAFFGYYLQGREEYAKYFLEDFVTQFDDLAWGVYSEE